jgi:hypothetical protein
MLKGFSVTQVLASLGITATPSAFTTTGVVVATDGSLLAPTFTFINETNTGIYRAASRLIGVTVNGTPIVGFTDNGGNIARFSGVIEFTTNIGNGGDLVITRDAADVFAQRRGTNGQTSRIYGTFTNASNYRRVAIGMTSGGVASIAPEGAGTGASGNVLHISGLPTVNPGPGILWNDGGAVKVGT